MARYHFNLHNGDELVEDEEGRELSGIDEARAEALKGIRSILAHEALQGRIDLRGRIEVRDEEGRFLFTLTYEEAVEFAQ